MRLAAALLLVATAVAAASAPASACTQQVVAKYHGQLFVKRAVGTLDRQSGTASLRVRHWTAKLEPDSDGLCLDQEPIVIAMGDTEQFTVPSPLVSSHRGRMFTYRAQKGTPGRGLRMLRIMLRQDGLYDLRFTLDGIEMSRLNTEDPICLPLAIIIGDDDFFNGIGFSSPSFSSKRLVVPTSCPIDNSQWPWIRG